MEQKDTVVQNGPIITTGGEIILYQPDSSIRLEVWMQDETVWLTQAQMAMLFGCSIDNISLHLKNLYAEGEIDVETTSEEISVVRTEGKRQVVRKIMHYNLDAILSVGYRVSSKSATRFRQWATSVLKDNYVDDSVLLTLAKREEGVSAEIVTRHVAETLKLDLERHNRQYPPVAIRECERYHDRFLIIDDTVYHLGASLKDLGKKMFAFDRMGVAAEEILTIL